MINDELILKSLNGITVGLDLKIFYVIPSETGETYKLTLCKSYNIHSHPASLGAAVTCGL